MFYSYCPNNNEEACGKNKFEASNDPEDDTEMTNLAALDADGKPKNDACTYDIKAPSNKFEKGAELWFKLSVIKKLKVYLKIGDDPKKVKSIKGRRRLLTVIEDKPLTVDGNYIKVPLSNGKLNLLVIPDPGTKPGDAKLKFNFLVKGDKIVPKPPTPPPVVKKPEAKPEVKP